MAKVLVTETYLDDIAVAIRSMAGTSLSYTPSEMASAIMEIQPSSVLESVSISSNGTYTPSSGVDGFNEVIVSVSGSGDYYEKYMIAVGSVTGSIYESSWTYVPDNAFAEKSNITGVSFPACTEVGEYAFGDCRLLSNISLPVCEGLYAYAFYGCENIEVVDWLPSCEWIEQDAFGYCINMSAVDLPACQNIAQEAFYVCPRLETVSFPAVSRIWAQAFYGCERLVSVYLMGSSVPSLSGSNAFDGTPIGGNSATAGQYGSIFVPSSLYASYIAANNWSYFSSRFVSV